MEAASAVTPLDRGGNQASERKVTDSPRVTQLGASRAGVLGVPAKPSQAPGAILQRVGGMGPSEGPGGSCLPAGLTSAPDTCTHHRPVGRVLARSAGSLSGRCCRVRQGMSVGGVAGGEDGGACACHPLGPLCPHPWSGAGRVWRVEGIVWERMGGVGPLGAAAGPGPTPPRHRLALVAQTSGCGVGAGPELRS